MVTGYTSQPYLHIPEYGLRRLIEQLDLLDKEESLFDEHIVKLIEEGPFSILGDLNLRSDLKKLLEIRATFVTQKTGIKGLVPVTRATQALYETHRGNYEMMRKLISDDSKSLEEYPLTDTRNPVHGIIELLNF